MKSKKMATERQQEILTQYQNGFNFDTISQKLNLKKIDVKRVIAHYRLYGAIKTQGILQQRALISLPFVDDHDCIRKICQRWGLSYRLGWQTYQVAKKMKMEQEMKNQSGT